MFGAKLTRTGSIAPSVRQRISRKAESPFAAFGRRQSKRLTAKQVWNLYCNWMWDKNDYYFSQIVGRQYGRHPVLQGLEKDSRQLWQIISKLVHRFINLDEIQCVIIAEFSHWTNGQNECSFSTFCPVQNLLILWSIVIIVCTILAASNQTPVRWQTLSLQNISYPSWSTLESWKPLVSVDKDTLFVWPLKSFWRGKWKW